MEEWNALQDAVRGEGGERLNAIARTLRFEVVARRFLHSRQVGRRILGIRTLGHLRDPSSWQSLQEQLNSANALVSFYAAAALVSIDAQRAMPGIMNQLAERESWPGEAMARLLVDAGADVAREPIRALMLSLAPAKIPPLLPWLAHVDAVLGSEVAVELLHRHPDDMHIAAAALLVILDPQLLPEFARYADAGDADVRQNLAVAYGQLGAIGDIEPVLRLMCDRVWWVRYRAGQALLKLKGMTADRLEAVRAATRRRVCARHARARACGGSDLMNVFRHALSAVQWGFLGYFVVLNVFYVGLAIIAMFRLRRYMGGVAAAERVYTHLQMPVSLVVPAYNEEGSIVTSVRALLQLRYQHFEVIIVNDGSKDDTLGTMIREFQLTPFPEAYRVQIKTQPIRGVYRSLKYPNLRVIDKENGGKADATNAGLNAARHPIFYCGDADSVLEVDSLEHVVRPFLEDPRTVACGGTVRIVNGCQVRGGVIEKIGLPKNPLALVQVVEYLRAFLGGRLGWSAVNGLLIVSGRFRRVSSRDRGRRRRLPRRRHRRGHGTRRAPASAPGCARPALSRLVHPGSGVLDRGAGGPRDAREAAHALAARPGREPVGEPQAVLRPGQWRGRLVRVPVLRRVRAVEPAGGARGLAVMALAWAMGGMTGMGVLAFVAAAFALGVMLSTTALLLEELSFHTYPKARHLLVLFAVSLLENFGYRQLNSWWRLKALWGWIRGERMQWGAMKRNASWQQ